MKDKSKVGPLSLEEQQRQARQDETGKIRRYLQLAEKLFNSDNDLTPDAA
jgi:hypothetical protein